MSWVGFATSAVSILDIVAILLLLKFWISPSDYGIATMAWWMFYILDHATDMGLSSAVIQRGDSTPTQLSTIFWINILLSLLLMGFIALGEPLMTGFYGHPVVADLMLLYSAKLVWQTVYTIPHAQMRQQIRYKELSVIRILANLGEFFTKIISAFLGAGVFAFVLGPLCRSLLTGIGIQLRNPWRPQIVFRLRESWGHIVFGYKTAASNILFHFYTNVDYPVVGYFFGDAALGVYRLAYEVVLEPVRLISEVSQEVAFSAFSRLKSCRMALIEQFISFTRLNLVAVMTYLSIVVITADDLLLLLFDDVYLHASLAIRVLALVGVLRALSTIFPPLLDGIGRPGRTFLYQCVASVLLPLCFLVAAHLTDGVGQGWFPPDQPFLSVALAWAVGYPIAFAALLTMGLRSIGLSWAQYLKKTLGIPACMFAAMTIGAGMQRWLIGAATPVRFFVVSFIMLGVIGTLLAFTQGISPRSLWATLKGPAVRATS